MEPAKRDAKKSGVTLDRIDGAPELTEEMLGDFELKYECKLPDDFRRFLLQNNGGFPSLDCVIFQESGRTTSSDVFCFHGIGDLPPWASTQWHYETFSERLPKNTIPIAHDSCGNLWLLNVGPDHYGSIIFWDHGTFANIDETKFDAWPQVASSFDEFVGKLHEYQRLPEEEMLPTRYTLVLEAVEGMAKESPGFDKHTAIDAAWHCNFTEDGNIEMQLVNYAPHAAVVHTDGYSSLRAAKGLIETGPPRLPQ